MACNIDIKKLKDNLTLDFNQRPSQTKRPIQLETPDVDKLALSTPEVAEFLSKKLPTVGPLPTFTRLQDSDDEKSSKLALALQWPDPNPHNNDNNSNNKIKKEINENSNIASFSGDSSIPLPNQEQAKLERKRLRNRIAAHKCRQRKLERINKLQIIKDKRKNKISELTQWNNILIDVNNKLNNILRKHREFGCDL